MSKILKAMLVIAIIFIGSHSIEIEANDAQVRYGVWTHIEEDLYAATIPVTDINTKIKVEILNMNMVLNKDSALYSSTDNGVDISWVTYRGYIDSEEFSMAYGVNSFTKEIKTGETTDNMLYIRRKGAVDSFSCDIRLTYLGVEYVEDPHDKTSGKIDTQYYARSNKCEVTVTTKSEYGVKKIQLYRKDSKNGKYKLVKTKYDGSDLLIETITDKGLKPNKQYWYKVKTLGWQSTKWSDFSPAKSYWTCPKKVKGDKIKGNLYTWKKGKKLSGYIVDVYYDVFVGYNIFGQRLYDSYTKSYFVKGTKFKIKQRKFNGANVRGYVKHNGKYYCTDGSVEKKKKNLKDNKVERYRE